MSDGTFNIFFTGLCAFVPRYDIRQYPKQNQMRVLLVESSMPSDLPAMHMSHAHEPHAPVFFCPNDHVYKGNGYRKPDIIYSGGDGEIAVFCLDGQDLGFKDVVEDQLEVVLGDHAGYGCPNGTNEESFEWVTNLAEVSPGSEQVAKSCLASDRLDPAVVARVKLARGKIYNKQFAAKESRGEDYGRVYLWEFKVPYGPKRGPEHHQAASNIVGFESNYIGAVELVSRRLRGGLNPRVDKAFGDGNTLPIKLVSKGEVTEIVAWVKNMPWADILSIREPQGYEADPDVHFSHVYKVSSGYDDANVPHYYNLCDYQIPIVHQGNPNCQPARTAPNDYA
jgi:hypothetical protein